MKETSASNRHPVFLLAPWQGQALLKRQAHAAIFSALSVSISPGISAKTGIPLSLAIGGIKSR